MSHSYVGIALANVGYTYPLASFVATLKGFKNTTMCAMTAHSESLRRYLWKKRIFFALETNNQFESDKSGKLVVL